MSKHDVVAFWLLPAAGTCAFFETLIAELATRCTAPPFEPHVTIGGGDIGEKRAGEILQKISTREPIQLEVERVDFSEEFTKTLFVQFRSSREIEALNTEIERASGNEYEINPHLSLLYKEMTAVEKAELARAISIPFAIAVFDRIKMMRTPHPITISEQVQAWRALGERALAQ